MASIQVNHITRSCKHCNSEFSFPAKRGKARYYCSIECSKNTQRTTLKEKEYPSCSVVDCDRPANRVGAGLCEAHYYQNRRNGYFGQKLRPNVLDHSHGYKLLKAPKHQLSTPCQQYRIYEHRAVYYDKHGEGPFNCVHCNKRVTWDDMHIDHLDDDPANNMIENLGASCPTCNQVRGRSKVIKAHRAKSRWQITWQGRTQHVGDWAEQIGIAVHVLKWRLTRWNLDTAMTAEVGPTGPKRSSS